MLYMRKSLAISNDIKGRNRANSTCNRFWALFLTVLQKENQITRGGRFRVLTPPSFMHSLCRTAIALGIMLPSMISTDFTGIRNDAPNLSCLLLKKLFSYLGKKTSEGRSEIVFIFMISIERITTVTQLSGGSFNSCRCIEEKKYSAPSSM